MAGLFFSGWVRRHTWEIVAGIIVLVVLCSLAVPAINPPGRGDPHYAVVSQLHALYLACFQMETDGVTTGDPMLGWPGELDHPPDPVRSNSDLMRRLVAREYLQAGDAEKITSLKGYRGWSEKLPPGSWKPFFKVYRITAKDPASAVLFSTRNFVYDTPVHRGEMLGDKFILIRKAGDGAVYKPPQALLPRVIGLLPGRADWNERPAEGAEDILEIR